jgi:hypothetical protein
MCWSCDYWFKLGGPDREWFYRFQSKHHHILQEMPCSTIMETKRALTCNEHSNVLEHFYYGEYGLEATLIGCGSNPSAKKAKAPPLKHFAYNIAIILHIQGCKSINRLSSNCNFNRLFQLLIQLIGACFSISISISCHWPFNCRPINWK